MNLCLKESNDSIERCQSDKVKRRSMVTYKFCNQPLLIPILSIVLDGTSHHLKGGGFTKLEKLWI